MKKSLINFLGLSTLAACALATANVQATALPPLVLDPLDNQVMTTATLPPRPSQGLPGFVPRFSSQETKPKNTMANGYKPLDPIVVAPEDSQVMTTATLPPAFSQPRPVLEDDEPESYDYQSSESHSEETPSYDSGYDNNYDYSYDYNYNQNYDYNYDYNYNYYDSNDYDYNYNYNYGHYNQYDYNTSYYYNN